jgi:hypothetical protein
MSWSCIDHVEAKMQELYDAQRLRSDVEKGWLVIYHLGQSVISDDMSSLAIYDVKCDTFSTSKELKPHVYAFNKPDGITSISHRHIFPWWPQDRPPAPVDGFAVPKTC